LKLAIVELGDANKEIEHVKSTIADKDLRISVIQSKVMEKINEQDAIVAKLENTKRINMNYENQIKALSAKLTQQTENHQEFDLKYLSLVKVEKFLREDNILLKKTANESDKKAQVVESKFSGIDIKYKNLLQEFEAMQKDYKNSIKALEQVNKTRNAYFDELQVNAEKYKTLTIQKETVDHQLYNEKALFTNLQQRLKDVEVEFEDQTRKETANSELAVAQILNLEEKHMAMLNRYKKETLMKSNWAQSYQREYNERMKLEIENKQLLGNLNGQENRNLDLQSNNDELTDRIRDLERRLDLVKDEKYDLLCKIERKNNQLESHKLTMDNLESHNETYTRKLRKLTNERVLKEKHATEILQMEVEDLHSKWVRYEIKMTKMETFVTKASNAYNYVKPDLDAKDAIIEELNNKFEDEETKGSELNYEIESLKLELRQKDEKITSYETKKLALECEKLELVNILQGNYPFNMLEYKEKEEQFKQQGTRFYDIILSSTRPHNHILINCSVNFTYLQGYFNMQLYI